MASLRLANVSFAYPHQSTLLDEINVDIESGWTGLVGPNGAGKTTLLRLLDGELRPTGGTVHDSGLRCVSCPQLLERTDAVDRFASAWTREALRWMSLLDLEPSRYFEGRLSPGLERRWQIAAALCEEPDVLLLDEPTNHLDAEGREVLLRGLHAFRGIGVICSHDRTLLDALCVRTLRVSGGRGALYPGPYTEARELWHAEQRAALEELEARQDEVRRLGAAARATADRHKSATRSLSSASRMESPGDHDARSMGAKFRAQRAEARISRDRGVIARTLGRATRELAELERPPSTPSELRLDGSAMRREWVTQFRFDELLGGPHRLLGETAVAIRRDDRLWVRGPNGCGKTTLLRRILEELQRDGVEVLHVPQNLEELFARTRESCAALSPDERTRTIELGAALGLAADAVLDPRPLSPGEHRKLVFALGLRASPAIVVLDEPTNDLDLESVERLEEALRDYPGALVVVTHDPCFAEAIEAEPWDLGWED